MKEISVKVGGMMCEGCENRIKKILGNVDGIKEVQASHKKGIVKVVCEEKVTKKEVEKLIEENGFELV